MEKLEEKKDSKGKVKGYELQDENGNFLDYFKFATHKQWHEALQEAPSKDMTKTRDLSGNRKSTYVPITIQEALSDVFFRECDIIDNVIEVYNNQIVVRIKLSILPNYPNAEHRTIAGVGSKMITGSKNALEYGSPAAQSAAKSNALTLFGNIFGRQLNRDYDNNYSFSGKDKEPEQTPQ